MVTNLQSELLEQQMLVENSKLEELRYVVLDMMEDYTAKDVRQVNLEYTLGLNAPQDFFSSPENVQYAL